MTSAEQSTSKLRGAFRACADLMFWTFVFGAGVNLLYLAPSLYMMQVYDRVLPSGGLYSLFLLSLALLLALGTLVALDGLRGRLAARMSLRLDRIIAPILLDYSMRRDASRDNRRTLALREFDTFRAILSGPALNALMDLPWMPLYVLVCFILHPAIGALALGGGMALVLLAIINDRIQRNSMRRASELAPRFYASAEADSAAAEAVTALGMRSTLVARQLMRRAELAEYQTGSLFKASFFSGSTKFVRQVLQSAALGLGAWLAVERQISPGALIAASILTSRALSPLDQIVASWRGLAQAATSLKLVHEVLQSATVTTKPMRLPAPAGALRFEQVSMRAPGTDRLALSGLNFEVAPGEVLGIVGASGAGKSTCARAAVGALKPDAGWVRLDGASLEDWEADALGRHVGYLPQDLSLLSGTVAENIRRFSPRDATADADVAEAARTAGAHDMILRLPRGYDTPLGLGGRGVSFGQAQRIALARALFRTPSLLVLDEPNAHLDGEGEEALARAVKGAKDRGAVILIVAQRTGVLALADRILSLRDGKIDRIETREDVIRRINAAQQGAAFAPALTRESRT